MENTQVDIQVGNGPVTKAGIYTQVAGGLVALASFLATITDNLPSNIDPSVGVWLTVGAGAVATLANFVVAFGRVNFAKAKADIIAGQSAYPAVKDAFDEDVVLDPEPPKSDTDVVPPIEPA